MSVIADVDVVNKLSENSTKKPINKENSTISKEDHLKNNDENNFSKHKSSVINKNGSNLESKCDNEKDLLFIEIDNSEIEKKDSDNDDITNSHTETFKYNHEYGQRKRILEQTRMKKNSKFKRIYQDKFNNCTKILSDIENDCSQNKKARQEVTDSFNRDQEKSESIKAEFTKSDNSQSSLSSSCSSSSGIGSSNGIIQIAHSSTAISPHQTQFDINNSFFKEKIMKSNSCSDIVKKSNQDENTFLSNLSDTSENINSPNKVSDRHENFTSEYESEESELDINENDCTSKDNKNKLKNNSINRMKKNNLKKQARISSLTYLFNKVEGSVIGNLLKTMNEILTNQSILTRKVDQMKDNFVVLNKRFIDFEFYTKEHHNKISYEPNMVQPKQVSIKEDSNQLKYISSQRKKNKFYLVKQENHSSDEKEFEYNSNKKNQLEINNTNVDNVTQFDLDSKKKSTLYETNEVQNNRLNNRDQELLHLSNKDQKKNSNKSHALSISNLTENNNYLHQNPNILEKQVNTNDILTRKHNYNMLGKSLSVPYTVSNKDFNEDSASVLRPNFFTNKIGNFIGFNSIYNNNVNNNKLAYIEQMTSVNQTNKNNVLNYQNSLLKQINSNNYHNGMNKINHNNFQKKNLNKGNEEVNSSFSNHCNPFQNSNYKKTFQQNKIQIDQNSSPQSQISQLIQSPHSNFHHSFPSNSISDQNNFIKSLKNNNISTSEKEIMSWNSNNSNTQNHSFLNENILNQFNKLKHNEFKSGGENNRSEHNNTLDNDENDDESNDEDDVHMFNSNHKDSIEQAANFVAQHQGIDRHVPSGSVDQLELDEESEMLVSREVIKRCVRKAKHRGNFAANLAAELFSKEERISCNCTGTRGKRQLSPRRLQLVKNITFRMYNTNSVVIAAASNNAVASAAVNSAYHDFEEAWRKECITAIDAKNRSIGRDLIKTSLHETKYNQLNRDNMIFTNNMDNNPLSPETISHSNSDSINAIDAIEN